MLRSRKAIKAKTGTVTYVPNMLHRAATDRMKVRKPHMFLEHVLHLMKRGFVSLSLGITYEKDIIENAEISVLEVNDQLPRTFGDTQVHVSDVTHFVEFSQLPPTLPEPVPDEVAIKK
ncbi:MAG: hypothetical protein R2771_09115 [Saprospiraceae bacterium]